MDQQAANALNALNKDPEEEARALAAVERHHAGMLKRLGALASALAHAVTSRDTVAEHDAHEVLVEWCETELVPHALAEEGPLYGGVRKVPECTLLVDGMLSEHRVIAAVVEELRGTAGVDAAVAAGSLRSIFALHVDKENSLLLPFIVASPALSLARTVEGLQELVGETHVQQHGTAQGDSV